MGIIFVSLCQVRRHEVKKNQASKTIPIQGPSCMVVTPGINKLSIPYCIYCGCLYWFYLSKEVIFYILCRCPFVCLFVNGITQKFVSAFSHKDYMKILEPGLCFLLVL